MSSIPPVSEVIDALLYAVVPAFGVTALAAGLIPIIFGRRAGFIAAAIAFVIGVAAANFFRGCFVLRFEADSPTSVSDLIRGLWSVTTGQLVLISGTVSEPIYPPRSGRYWIPWAALIATSAGLITRLSTIPTGIAYLVRIVVTAIVTKVIIPADLAVASPWLPWMVAMSILIYWIVTERRTAIPNEVPSAAAGLASLGAAAVLLHAHSARLTDCATLIAFASFGVALVACWKRIDAAGIAPAMAVSLPGILVSGYHETFSAVPAIAFVLPVAALLATTLLLFVPQRFIQTWRVWAIAIFLSGLPTAIAVIIASRAETLDFGH